MSVITNDRAEFKVALDMQQFNPEDVVVKTVDNYLVIEASHEDKDEKEGGGVVERHFTRKYLLPEGIKTDEMKCDLSADGVLTIHAPKITTSTAPMVKEVPVTRLPPPAPQPERREEKQHVVLVEPPHAPERAEQERHVAFKEPVVEHVLPVPRRVPLPMPSKEEMHKPLMEHHVTMAEHHLSLAERHVDKAEKLVPAAEQEREQVVPFRETPRGPMGEPLARYHLSETGRDRDQDQSQAHIPPPPPLPTPPHARPAEQEEHYLPRPELHHVDLAEVLAPKTHDKFHIPQPELRHVPLPEERERESVQTGVAPSAPAPAGILGSQEYQQSREQVPPTAGLGAGYNAPMGMDKDVGLGGQQRMEQIGTISFHPVQRGQEVTPGAGIQNIRTDEEYRRVLGERGQIAPGEFGERAGQSKSFGERIGETAEATKEGAKEMGEKTKEGVKELGEKAKDTAKGTGEWIKDTARGTKESAQEFGENVKETAKDIKEGIEEKVRQPSVDQAAGMYTKYGTPIMQSTGARADALPLGETGGEKVVLGQLEAPVLVRERELQLQPKGEVELKKEPKMEQGPKDIPTSGGIGTQEIPPPSAPPAKLSSEEEKVTSVPPAKEELPPIGEMRGFGAAEEPKKESIHISSEEVGKPSMEPVAPMIDEMKKSDVGKDMPRKITSEGGPAVPSEVGPTPEAEKGI